MATCQTAQWDSYAPYVKLTVTESSSTETAVTLAWTLQYIAQSAASTNGVGRAYTVKIGGATVKSGTYNINGVSGTKTIASGSHTVSKTTAAQSVSFSVSFAFNVTWSGTYGGTKSASGSISVAAKTSYTVKYNANGGSGAPSAQTKWHGTALTLSSTKPTRTGYVFQGWATSASGGVAYSAGGSYTANAAVTLYAVWKANTYAVKYDANGGSGAPSNQTKTYGVALTLSSTKPTRTNYNFLGWGTSASATTVSYAAGASYTANAAITLYAVWELAYTKPLVSNVAVSRSDADGNATDTGTYITVSFDWSTFQAVKAITIAISAPSADTITINIPASGTSGSYYNVLGDGGIATDSTYTVTITVADSGGSTPITRTVEGEKFVVDFLAGGNGVAMGKPAELDGVFDVAFRTRHYGGLLPLVLPAETDLNQVLTPNTYTGENISSYNYANCPVESGTFTLLVESCGDEGQIKQTYCSCSKYKPERYSRFYYQGTWGAWFWANTDEYILYENDSGTNAAITTAEALSHFRYIEIYFTDNNGKTGGYTKIFSPNGKTACLSIVEAATATSKLIRETEYTLSGTAITPKTESAGYFQISSARTISGFTVGTNYLKIVRVIGRA